MTATPGSTPTTAKNTTASTTKPRRARKQIKAGQGLKATQATTATKPAKKAATNKKATPTKKKVAAKKKPATKTPTPEKKSPKGCLEAALLVLSKSKKPLGCKPLIDAILEQKLWSTQGATPHQTLSSAIQREINKKGKESRFVKSGRGLYTVKGKAPTSGRSS